MIYELTKEDLERLGKEGIEYLIRANKERLEIWSIPDYEKEEIKKEIAELEKMRRNNTHERKQCSNC